MTNEQQIKALAELDELEWMRDPNDNCWCWFHKVTKWFCGKNLFTTDSYINWDALPPYITSYDAIIPLIQKQDSMTRTRIAVSLSVGQNNTARSYDYMMQTPSQLSEALLRATNRWTE